MTSNRRLFVGNLPSDVNEDDIRQEFSAYGTVTTVEIKQKKDCLNENKSNKFAFINLDIDTWNLNRCIQEFSHQQWRGHYLKVATAKESFLEQLQRERLEAQAQQKGPKQSFKVETQDETPKVIKQLYTDVQNKHFNYEKVNEKEYKLKSKTVKLIEKEKNNLTNDSSSSKDESEEDQDTASNKSLPTKDIIEDNDFIIKSNKHNFLNPEKLKIPSYGQAIVLRKDKTPEKQLTPQMLLAEQKRKQALLERREQYNKQKLLLQKGFLKIDKKPKNKIIFQESNKAYNRHKDNHNNSNYEKQFERKLSLFNENDEDDDYMLDIKQQFHGSEGQKLLKLQLRFANDKRFALDSRFLEDGNMNENEDFPNSVNELSTVQEEQKKQFDILKDVLGNKVDFMSEQIQKNSSLKHMLRYDPMKSNHNKFINKNETNNSEMKKKNKVKVSEEVIQEEPVVLKEKFFAVPENLKQSMEKSSGFSLLGMFGQADTQGDCVQDEYKANSYEMKAKKESHSMGTQDNPFHYDSSDSDEEINGEITAKSAINNSKIGQMSSTGVWRENFFFKDKDERILEGIKFFTNVCTFGDSKKTFENTRRELKKVIKYKVLQNLRNKRPFQKKLSKISHNVKKS